MDIRGFVYGLADIFPGPLKTAARWVADRVFAVWDDVSNVFRVVVPNWRDLANSISWFTDRAVGAVEKAALALRWIVTVRIPQAIEVFRQSVVNWVSGLLNAVRSDLIAVRDWVLGKAWEFANTVLSFARSVYDWAVARLREIWEPLAVVIDRVGSLLFDPTRFARWVIGGLWGVFWSYVDQHVDAIIEFVWARRGTIVAKVIARTEAILERVL